MVVRGLVNLIFRGASYEVLANELVTPFFSQKRWKRRTVAKVAMEGTMVAGELYSIYMFGAIINSLAAKDYNSAVSHLMYYSAGSVLTTTVNAGRYYLTENILNNWEKFCRDVIDKAIGTYRDKFISEGKPIVPLERLGQRL